MKRSFAMFFKPSEVRRSVSQGAQEVVFLSDVYKSEVATFHDDVYMALWGKLNLPTFPGLKLFFRIFVWAVSNYKIGDDAVICSAICFLNRYLSNEERDSRELILQKWFVAYLHACNFSDELGLKCSDLINVMRVIKKNFGTHVDFKAAYQSLGEDMIFPVSDWGDDRKMRKLIQKRYFEFIDSLESLSLKDEEIDLIASFIEQGNQAGVKEGQYSYTETIKFKSHL